MSLIQISHGGGGSFVKHYRYAPLLHVADLLANEIQKTSFCTRCYPDDLRILSVYLKVIGLIVPEKCGEKGHFPNYKKIYIEVFRLTQKRSNAEMY